MNALNSSARGQSVKDLSGRGGRSSRNSNVEKASVTSMSSNKQGNTDEELLEAQAELKRRAEYIKGVQRNYDTIAQLCSKNLQSIASLTEELDQTKATLLRLKKSESDFANGKETVVRLKGETTKLQAQVNEYEDQTKVLSKKCLDYQSHISDLNDIKEELSRQVEEMQALAQSRKDEIAELQFMLKDEDGQRELQNLTETNGNLEQELRSTRAQMEALNQAKKASDLSLQKAENRLRRMEMDKDNFQTDVQRIKDKSWSTRNELTEAQKALEAERQKCESLEIDNHSLNNEIKMFAHLGPELEKKLAFSERARITLQEQYDVMWAEKADVDMNMKEAEEQVLMLQVQLGKITSESVKEKEDFQNKLDLAMQGKGNLIKEKSAAVSEKNKALTEIEQMTKDLKLLTEKNQRLRKHRSELELKITEMEAEHDEWVEQKNRLMKKQFSQADLVQEITDLKSEVKKLERIIEGKDSDIAIGKSEATNLKADNHRLQSELDGAKKKSAEQLQKALVEVSDKHSEKIDKFQAELASLSKKLMNSDQKNKELMSMLEDSRTIKEPEVDVEKLKKKERELQVAISKIISVEEASEASFTCVQCMDLFENAVTCIPCGHSYCDKCIKASKICPQCGPGVKITYYPNELLEDLTTKFRFRKTSLAGLKRMIASSVPNPA